MNHWAFFPLYTMLVVICNDVVGKGTPHVLLWLILGILPFLLYLGRRHLKKFVPLALLHLSVIIAMFLLPAEHISIRILYLLVGIGYVVYSCYLWASTTHRQDTACYPLLVIALFVTTLYTLHYQGHTEWDTTFVILLIAVLEIYFIVYYIEQYRRFLTVNDSSAGYLPASEMFRSGMGLVLGYTAIGILVMIFISNINWLQSIFHALKGIPVAFIRMISSLIPRNTVGTTEEITEETLSAVEEMEFTEEIGESFWGWNILEYIVEIILLVLFLYVLIKAFVFLIRFIRNKLGSYHRGMERAPEEAVSDIHEKCDIIREKEHKSILSFLQMNPKERIRHLYKKRIQEARFERPDRYTPRESGKILGRAEMASIYEKARYSKTECTGEDVKKMRHACK